MQPAKNSTPQSAESSFLRSVVKEISDLQDQGLVPLRARYAELFGEEAKSKNLPYLRKKIAFRLQEHMEGGLSEEALARIQELAPEGQTSGIRPAKRRILGPQNATSAPSEPRDPRLPMAGTILAREFKGFAHSVTVQEHGFTFRGRTYRSLSAVAKEITGTPWNGFLFFGLTRRGTTDGR